MEECIICFEERQDFKFYSCGHKLCTECYHKIYTCPLCQSRKIEIVVVQPTAVTSVHSYHPIRCIVCLFLSSIIFLYFYHP